MSLRKRKNSAPLLSNNKKGQPTFSLSQPLPSRSTGHTDNNTSVDQKGKHRGDRPTFDENLLCYQCHRIIGSSKESGTCNNYVFNCSICSSCFHGDCLDFDPSTIDLIHAVFDSVPWVCDECKDLARNARNKGKNSLKSKPNAVTELDAVNARLVVLEQTVQKLERSLATNPNHSPGRTQPTDSHPLVSDQSNWTSIAMGGKVDGKKATGTADLIKAVHKDLISQRERQKNIIVSGMKPSATIADKDLIKNLVGTHLGIIPIPEPSFVRRLKTSSKDKIPPLLVCFPTETAATEILSQARNLRKSTSDYIKSNVYINRDLTKSEAAAAFEIREKRRIKHRQSQSTGNDHSALPSTSIPLRFSAPSFIPSSSQAQGQHTAMDLVRSPSNLSTSPPIVVIPAAASSSSSFDMTLGNVCSPPHNTASSAAAPALGNGSNPPNNTASSSAALTLGN